MRPLLIVLLVTSCGYQPQAEDVRTVACAAVATMDPSDPRVQAALLACELSAPPSEVLRAVAECVEE